MQDGASKTDKKDAYSIFDLLQQGKFFLPVERDDELKLNSPPIADTCQLLKAVFDFAKETVIVTDISVPCKIAGLVENHPA